MYRGVAPDVLFTQRCFFGCREITGEGRTHTHVWGDFTPKPQRKTKCSYPYQIISAHADKSASCVFTFEMIWNADGEQTPPSKWGGRLKSGGCKEQVKRLRHGTFQATSTATRWRPTTGMNVCFLQPLIYIYTYIHISITIVPVMLCYPNESSREEPAPYSVFWSWSRQQGTDYYARTGNAALLHVRCEVPIQSLCWLARSQELTWRRRSLGAEDSPLRGGGVTAACLAPLIRCLGKIWKGALRIHLQVPFNCHCWCVSSCVPVTPRMTQSLNMAMKIWQWKQLKLNMAKRSWEP